MHHPSFANSLAPGYASIYNHPPTMLSPGRDSSYELSHATYIARFRDWETQLRYYPESAHFRPTQLIVQFIHGLLRELRPHVLAIESLLLRHQATHRFQPAEPSLPPSIDSRELHEVLTAAVRSLDMAGHPSKSASAHVGAIMPSSFTSSSAAADDPDDSHMDYFAHFCDQDLATDGPSFDVCVAAIQRFQQSRFQRGSGRGRGMISTPTACLFGPCSRTHPPEQCCICRAVHPVRKCWHVTGLPDSVLSTANNFKKLMQAKEGPWKQEHSIAAVSSSTPTVSFDAACAHP